MTAERRKQRPDQQRLDRTARAEMYFWAYIGMGSTRGIRPLARLTKGTPAEVSVATLERYSREFGWAERAAEIDRQRAPEGLRLEDAIAEAVRNDARHAQIGRLLQAEAMRGIQAREGNREAPPLTGSEIARLADVGVKIERLASGQATDIHQMHVASWEVITVSLVDLFVESVGAAMAVFARVHGDDPALREEAQAAAFALFGRGADRIVDQHFRAVGATGVQVGMAPD